MLRLRLIEEMESGQLKALKRDYVYTTLDPDIVRQMTVALHVHAETLDHNLNSARKTPVRFERLADNAHVSVRKVVVSTRVGVRERSW